MPGSIGETLWKRACGKKSDWVKVGRSATGGGYDAYADLTTIRRSGDKVKMWEMLNYETKQVTPSGKRYLSLKIQMEFDCKDKRNRNLYFTFNSGNMGAGAVVLSSSKPSNWTPNVPGTIGEILWKRACGKK